MGWIKDRGKRQSRESEGLAREQAETARVSRRIATQQWNDWKQYGRPELLRLTEDIANWGSAGHIAEREGRAVADVSAQFGQARNNFNSNISRYGLRPGDGRFSGTHRALALGEAGATAQARTDARNRVINEGIQLRGGLVDGWRGNIGQAFQGLGQASAGFGSAAGQFGQLAGQNRDFGLARWKTAIEGISSLADAFPGKPKGP